MLLGGEDRGTIPRTPSDFSLWAKIEVERRSDVFTPLRPSTLARIGRSSCVPAELYPPARLQEILPMHLVGGNRSNLLPGVE